MYDLTKILPATVSIRTASFLKELADHGWLAAAAALVMRVSTVVPLFAKAVHEIPWNKTRDGSDTGDTIKKTTK